MLNKLELVARPEEVQDAFMDKALVCRTGANTAPKSSANPRQMANQRDPFPFEQATEEEFRRMRRFDRHCRDAKYTYFMRNKRNGLIKIGMSFDPEDRRGRLSASGELDMEILLTLRDGNLEGCYHQHFADLRVEGEWFEPHPDIFAEIERLSAPNGSWNIG